VRREHLQQGFTLIEILVVVVILGTLAGIVVFAVTNLSDDAGKGACATEAHNFETAVTGYKTHHNALPQPPALPAAQDATGVAETLANDGSLASARLGLFGTGPANWSYDVPTGVVTRNSECK
jgi:prepilin-type N-terminal cleavage/methylation domain-containing protein